MKPLCWTAGIPRTSGTVLYLAVALCAGAVYRPPRSLRRRHQDVGDPAGYSEAYAPELRFPLGPKGLYEMTTCVLNKHEEQSVAVIFTENAVTAAE